ncbi:MAG: hypothetical protein P1U34_07300 [Coxiellaceae bacterium]|nr:hypothetical protein [Coxiellaceae bacterium]
MRKRILLINPRSDDAAKQFLIQSPSPESKETAAAETCSVKIVLPGNTAEFQASYFGDEEITDDASVSSDSSEAEQQEIALLSQYIDTAEASEATPDDQAFLFIVKDDTASNTTTVINAFRVKIAPMDPSSTNITFEVTKRIPSPTATPTAALASMGTLAPSEGSAGVAAPAPQENDDTPEASSPSATSR